MLVLTAIVFLFALVSADDKRRHRPTNHFSYRNVKLVPDIGYYAINFKPASIPVSTAFYFHSDRPTLLTVLDCFCAGDSFVVFDNSVYLAQTSGPDTGDNTCAYFSYQPVYCMLSGEFDQAVVPLLPGYHNITIVPIVTPYGEGTAFLRLDFACSGFLPPKAGLGVNNATAVAGLTNPAACCISDNSCKYNTVN